MSESGAAPCGCKGKSEKWCGLDTIIVVWACGEHRAKANVVGKRMMACPVSDAPKEETPRG